MEYSYTEYERISSKKDGKQKGKTNNLLFYIFIIFALATFVFVGYIGVDHFIERTALDDQIETLEKKLGKLKEEINRNAEPSRAREEGLEISDEINAMVERQRKCDRTSAALRQIKSIVNGNEDYMKIWHESPKPFIHLTSSKPDTVPEEENLEGMKTVTGWKLIGGGECESDPQQNGNDIVIPDGGNYTVYSQIIFNCNGREAKPVIQRHLVQYIEVFAQWHDTPRPLMESAYQMCGEQGEGKTRISYQSGIYRFNKDDILRVVVEKGDDTSLYDENDNVNKASFGVYSL